MGDQNNCRPSRLFQVVHQVENLCLHRDIQCGRWFVGKQNLWVAAQRHCNHDPLPHTTRHGVRITAVALLRVGKSDLAEHVDGDFLCLFTADVLVLDDAFTDLTSHPHGRVEAGHRILKDHRKLLAAVGFHLLIGFGYKVYPFIQNLTRFDTGRRGGKQPHNRLHADALAAA